MSKLEGITIKGWSIFAHPLFIEQVETLIEEVEELRNQELITVSIMPLQFFQKC
ncbi:hypothetical protein Lnau_2867 [Legionella nautarum]|uniref:Uncharacterized protein n=1 Tax=Legionella nautarum TaxID=45070 RepID=A0A0W0WLT9_9GAMM|nr:hypothetical protein [Legionella nautarum]KTD33219.1 hypothetical protein Lnau_2867 [Legionella nautarum]